MIGYIARLFLPGGLIGGNPLVSLLILGAVVGMSWSYYQGYSGANERFEAARSEAIQKNSKENAAITKEAHKDEMDHHIEVAKSQEQLKVQINEIENISDACLDVDIPERLRKALN